MADGRDADGLALLLLGVPPGPCCGSRYRVALGPAARACPLLLLQVLVTAATVVAVIFVVLLSLPKAGGPVVLPALGVLWGTCSGLALLLHAELPVTVDRANSRLFPDSKVQVRRRRATSSLRLCAAATQLPVEPVPAPPGPVLRAAP